MRQYLAHGHITIPIEKLERGISRNEIEKIFAANNRFHNVELRSNIELSGLFIVSVSSIKDVPKQVLIGKIPQSVLESLEGLKEDTGEI